MESIGIREEIELNWLLNVLGKYQEQLFKLNNELKKFSFNWENATTEYVEMRNETELYNWLYPIKFCSIQAFVLEILQEDILANREKAFQLICFKFNMSLETFYKAIEELQNLLVEFEKVKICKNGKVIMMNDVW